MAETTPIPAPRGMSADSGGSTEWSHLEPREQGHWVTASSHALTSGGGAEMEEKLGQQSVHVSWRQPPWAGPAQNRDRGVQQGLEDGGQGEADVELFKGWKSSSS